MQLGVQEVFVWVMVLEQHVEDVDGSSGVHYDPPPLRGSGAKPLETFTVLMSQNQPLCLTN